MAPCAVAEQVSFTRLQVKHGKSKTAKVWQASAPAVLTVALRRYNSGMTVGHGWYHKYSHTDPVGAACGVLGWFSDGRVNVNLPAGGCALMGRADVDVTTWPDYVTDGQRASWDAIPKISLVIDGELQKEPTHDA